MSAVEGVQTFLIADIRGYTRYTAEHGDEAAATLASGFADIVGRVVGERDGRLIELRGDEALVAFASARQAIRAAVELQTETQGLPRGIGIGLDAGEAVPVAEGYRGGALNLASRLCSLAGPGEVLASETVVQLARAIDGIRYGGRRTERVKGIAKPVTVIEVLGPQSAGQAGRLRSARRLWRRPGVRIGSLVALAAVLVIASIVALVTRGTPSGAAGAVRLLPNSLASYDPATHRVLSDTRLDGKPSSVTTDRGRAWALSHNGRVLTSAARSGHGLRSFPLHGNAAGQWAGAGTVDTANDFVAVAGSNDLTEISQAIGGDAGAALRPDSPIKPWQASPTDAECAPYVTGSGSIVWFSRGRRLAKIDGATGLVTQTYSLPQATSAPRSVTCYAVRFSGGRLLAARSPDNSIGSVDPATGKFRRIVTGISGVMPAADGDLASTWTATPTSLWIVRAGTLLDVDMKTGKTAARLPVGSGAHLALSSAGGIFWALGEGGSQLLRVDPAAHKIAERITLSARARDLATASGRIWLAIGSA